MQRLGGVQITITMRNFGGCSQSLGLSCVVQEMVWAASSSLPEPLVGAISYLS